MKRPPAKKQAPHFSQRIEFQFDVEKLPPPYSAQAYSFDALIDLRDRLNEVKSQMDKYYVGAKTDPRLRSRWGRLNSIVDIYRPLKGRIMRDYGAQLVTNAWMKYFEMYIEYGLIDATPNAPEPFTAFFNAELPGAAVCAYNHFIKTRKLTSARWVASSLAPDSDNVHGTSVFGDNYGLFEHNRDQWMMQTVGDPESFSITPETVAAAAAIRGDDDAATPSKNQRNNGDATVLENLLDFEVRLGGGEDGGSGGEGVNLYSSDAGIDVSETDSGELNFNNQELANARIHLGCAIAGLLTLRRGGSFVVKQYTFFETFTNNLILIYAQLFDDFRVCKPVTSRPYNSEIYLVGRGFRGITAATRTFLLRALAEYNPARPLIPAEMIPAEARDELVAAARGIFEQQIEFIEENLRLMDEWGHQLDAVAAAARDVRQRAADGWLRKYDVRAILQRDWIPQSRRPDHSDALRRPGRDRRRRGGGDDGWTRTGGRPSINYDAAY